MVSRGRRFGLAVVVAALMGPSAVQAAPVNPQWWALVTSIWARLSPVTPQLKVCEGVTTDPNGCPKVERPKERPPLEPPFAGRPNA